MSLSIYREHLEYAVKVIYDVEEYTRFINNLPDQFIHKLDELLGEFFKNVNVRPRGYHHVGSFFCQYMCWIIVPLYKANSDKLPEDIVQVYEEVKGNCFSSELINEREIILSAMNSDWIMGAKNVAQQYRLYPYGAGPIYALAEAFLEAKRREEDKQRLADEMVWRDAKLKKGKDTADFIKGLESIDDLPEGKKNIGEE